MKIGLFFLCSHAVYAVTAPFISPTSTSDGVLEEIGPIHYADAYNYDSYNVYISVSTPIPMTSSSEEYVAVPVPTIGNTANVDISNNEASSDYEYDYEYEYAYTSDESSNDSFEEHIPVLKEITPPSFDIQRRLLATRPALKRRLLRDITPSICAAGVVSSFTNHSTNPFAIISERVCLTPQELNSFVSQLLACCV